MEFNNDMVAMFNKAKKMAEDLQENRINSSIILYLLLERKGYIYKILSQVADDSQIMDFASEEVKNYDDLQVISEFTEDDIAYLESQGIDVNENGDIEFILEVDGKQEIYIITMELLLIISYLGILGIKDVDINIFEVSFFSSNISKGILSIFRKFKLDFEDIDWDKLDMEMTDEEVAAINKYTHLSKEIAEKYDKNLEKKQEWKDFIPKALMDTLQEFDYKKDLRINARSKEIDEVWNVFMKVRENNVVLVGDENIGKSAIVEKVAYLINNDNCPEQFRGYHIVNWDLNSMFLSTESDIGQTFEYLKKWFKNRNRVILVIDELPSVVESSKMFSISIILKYAIKVFLESGENRLIVICNPDEYYLYFNETHVMPKVFESIYVEEPKTSEVYPMVKKQIDFLQEKHNVKISRKNIELIITIAGTLFDENNPGKTLRIIEKSLITAKISNRKQVTRQDILKNCNLDFDKLKAVNKNYIRSTAFHEAGHYIVGKMSKSTVDTKPVIISIIPGHYFEGVTVFQPTDIGANLDEDWIIERVAMLLAGRVAESVFTGKLSGGARSDLHYATMYVESMITDFGMTDFAKNMVFDYEFCSDSMKEEIFNIKSQIIQKAYDLAEKILNENKELLYKLVDELEKKLILNEKELNRIVKSIKLKQHNIRNHLHNS